MTDIKIDQEFFSSRLDFFLLELRKEIDSVCQPAVKGMGEVENLDDYVYQLNTFYYRSFHERFFSEYKSSIQEEVTRLLRLGRQEEMLKKDILATIKRYAVLYNQVKKLSTILQAIREESNRELLHIKLNNEQPGMELFYALKNLQQSLKSLNNDIEEIFFLLKDKKLRNVLEQFPDTRVLLRLISSLDTDKPRLMDKYKRLMMQLHQCRSLLRHLRQNKYSGNEISRELSKHIKEDFPLLLKELAAANLLPFYEKTLQKRITMYVDLLELHIRLKQETQISAAARDFEDYLEDFLTLADKASLYRSEKNVDLLDSAALIAEIKQEDIENWKDGISSIFNSLNNLVNELPESGEADYSYFSKKTREILNKAHPLLNSSIKERVSQNIPPLGAVLNRVHMELSLLQAKIDFLDEKYLHSSTVLQSFLSIVNTVDAQLNFLANIKADLERLLAPRNIARVWKDMHIRVERIAMEKGKPFPTDYLYLLDKYQVETRISEDKTNTILHEEGDIFIIKVDDLLEEDLPYLVVSQRA